MNKPQWWLYLRTIVLVVRVIVFEKYTTVTALLWWLFVALSALFMYWIHYGIALGIIAFGVLFYGKIQHILLDKKYLLIRPGDRVEYVLSDQGEALVQFATAKVLRRLSAKEVLKTSLFDADHLDLYAHFYLVDSGKKNEVIAYEWIVGIEAGDLEG